MKISPVINTDKTNFKSCFRMYNSKDIKKFAYFGKPNVLTTTGIFRNDLEWKSLIKYLNFHFADKSNVNIYSLACSDGSEAYSFVISLMEFLSPEQVKKYLPLHACDIDDEVLKAAKSGRINMYTTEFLNPEKSYNIDIGKYFKNRGVSLMIDGDSISETDTIHSYKVDDNLLNSVKYKTSDILTELENLHDEGNSVILCRNVFPYLSSYYTVKVIDAAKHKLKTGSIFVIGDFDGSVIEKELLNNGFFRPMMNGNSANCSNVFQRGSDERNFKKLYSGCLI